MTSKIAEILAVLKDYILYAKRGGSSAISVINNKHDYDIIIISKDIETSFKGMSLFRRKFDVKDLFSTYGLDIHFLPKEYEDEHLLENPYYSYIIKESLLTEYNIEDRDIDYLLAHQDETILKLKEKILSKYSIDNEKKYKHKIWYRTYMTLCIYKNKSVEFTAEQIKNINILHDRKDSELEARTVLINNIIKEIDEWQIQKVI